MLFGRVISVRDVQLLKHKLLKLFTVSGNVMLVSDAHPWNALSPKEVTELGTSTDTSPEFWNAYLPIEVIVSGIVTLVSFEQPEKSPSLIEVRVLGITIDVIPEFWKVYFASDVTVSGIVTLPNVEHP